MSSNFVDSADSIRVLVEIIEKSAPKPFIFIDLEGINLSRHGSIAIMQILVPPSPTVHLVDVFLLQAAAFDTTSAGGKSLRSILESSDYPKIFFDVRNDSDALYSHFQISLHGVIDLQLIEFATRPGRGRFVKGLAKCISEDGRLGWSQMQEWQRVKEDGQRLFAPEKGGKYEVFLERPLPTAIANYCAQDVLMMPKLLVSYGQRIKPHLATQVHAEGQRRITLSQSWNFNGMGRHMAVGPTFAWTGHQNEPPPKFPLSVICSPVELISRCFLNEGLACERLGEKPTASSPSPNSTVTRNAAGEVAAALSCDFETLQIGHSTNRGTEAKDTETDG